MSNNKIISGQIYSESVLNCHEEPTRVTSQVAEIAFRMKDLTRHTEEQILNDIETEVLNRVEALMYAHGINFETVGKIMSFARMKEK